MPAKIALAEVGILPYCLITYKPPEEQRELCDTNYQYYSEQDGKCVDIPDFREEEIARREKEMQTLRLSNKWSAKNKTTAI